MTFTETTPPNSSTTTSPIIPGTTVTTNPGQYTAPVIPVAPTPPRVYTEEELRAAQEAARKEEHSKLYGQIDQYKSKAEQLEAERVAREEAKAKNKAEKEAEEQRKAEEKAEKKRREEMSAKETIEDVERKWQQKLEAVQQESERRLALFQKEQELSQLRDYRHRVLAQHADQILPELQEDLTGPLGDLLETPQQIDEFVNQLVNKSASIMKNFTDAQLDARRGTPTASTRSTPPGYDPNADPGVVGQAGELTAEQIRNMSSREYAAIRNQLPTGRAGGITNRGLFD